LLRCEHETLHALYTIAFIDFHLMIKKY